jgi:hypothetical protein
MWLALVAVLALIAGCGGSHTTRGQASPSIAIPDVDTAATPPGWVPVDYRNAQISVPSIWLIGKLDRPVMQSEPASEVESLHERGGQLTLLA